MQAVCIAFMRPIDGALLKIHYIYILWIEQKRRLWINTVYHHQFTFWMHGLNYLEDWSFLCPHKIPVLLLWASHTYLYCSQLSITEWINFGQTLQAHQQDFEPDSFLQPITERFIGQRSLWHVDIGDNLPRCCEPVCLEHAGRMEGIIL